MRWTLLACAGLAAAGLTGCSALSTRENVGPCPRAYALYDAVRQVEFKDGVEAYANVGFTGEIQRVHTLCRYFGDKPIKADLEIDIGFGRGPAAEGRKHTYRYWVAVTRKDLTVITKQYFDVNVNFDKDERRLFRRERIERIEIPRADEETSGANFEILVGFDVTQEQLEFNRLGKRFTVDAAR